MFWAVKLVPKVKGCDAGAGVLVALGAEEPVAPNVVAWDGPLVAPNIAPDAELLALFCPRLPKGLLCG